MSNNSVAKEMSLLMEQKILLLDGASGTFFQKKKLSKESYSLTKEHIKNLNPDIYKKDIAGNIPERVFETLPTDQFSATRAIDEKLADCYEGNHDILNITKPQAVAEMHKKHLEAGADIIETNTFNSNRISQDDYGLGALVQMMNFSAAKIARNVADKYSGKAFDKKVAGDDKIAADKIKKRYVAGSIGPTPKTASVSNDVNDPAARKTDFQELYGIYFESALSLLAGGVDMLLIETAFDTLNAKAAATASKDACKVFGVDCPLVLSVTLTDLAGRNLSGQTIEAFLISMMHFKPLALGLNCSLGAAEMGGFVAELSRMSPFPVIAYPNAGMPNELGEYDEDPASFAGKVSSWANNGLVNIVGGCCGSTPEHIAALSKAIINSKPRSFAGIESQGLWVSGIDPLIIADPAKLV